MYTHVGRARGRAAAEPRRGRGERRRGAGGGGYGRGLRRAWEGGARPRPWPIVRGAGVPASASPPAAPPPVVASSPVVEKEICLDYSRDSRACDFDLGVKAAGWFSLGLRPTPRSASRGRCGSRRLQVPSTRGRWEWCESWFSLGVRPAASIFEMRISSSIECARAVQKTDVILFAIAVPFKDEARRRISCQLVS